eukprot:768715-Hanusia_phi.AAC.10
MIPLLYQLRGRQHRVQQLTENLTGNAAQRTRESGRGGWTRGAVGDRRMVKGQRQIRSMRV